MMKKEKAIKWNPVPDINDGFEAISFSYHFDDARTVSVVMHGERNLHLKFTHVTALHYEDECPGNFPRPPELPMLKSNLTFPLLRINESKWRAQWLMYTDLIHYFLISSDDLVHLVAGPNVDAKWK
jgi:hypothetical protein